MLQSLYAATKAKLQFSQKLIILDMQNTNNRFKTFPWRWGLFCLFGMFLSILCYFPSLAQTAPRQSCFSSGNVVTLNTRKFSLPWCQSKATPEVRTFLSDTGAMQLLGLDLLSTNNLKLQPVDWFFLPKAPRYQLATQLVNPFRYLDITQILAAVDAKLNVSGKTLNISTIPADISNVWGGDNKPYERLIVELNRPTFWQINQANDQAILTIEGIAPPALLERFSGEITPDQPLQESEELLNNQDKPQEYRPLVVLETNKDVTTMRVKLPPGNRLAITSLADPYRLLLDIRPDVMTQRDIIWGPGLIWHQRYIKLSNQVKFPVFWLEIDLKNSGLSFRPISSDANKLIGVAPLVNTARNLKAIAAINGGYFNRKTQQPLGGIRRYGQWLSGPILNRGVIAWNNKGSFKISRLTLDQSLITVNNTKVSIPFFNSGYAKEGIAMYTKEWGATYTTLTDDEVVFVVQNNKITRLINAGKAQEDIVAIPSNGYLLTTRGDISPPPTLAVGKTVKLKTTLNPAYLKDYPFVIGAGPVLLQNGKTVLDVKGENFNSAFGKQTASRSAIGTTAQQKLIIAAVHNRVGGKGATLGELGQIMRILGASDALNLDGGSSTALYLGGNLIDRPQETAAKVHNGIGVFWAQKPQ